MRRRAEQRDQGASALRDMSSRRQENFLGIRKLQWYARAGDNRATLLEDAQKGCPARPQRAKIRGVPSGAHGATNKEHHVCARRRVVRRPGLR